ncbi:MAG TPA: hypothetical protein VJ259_07935 [Actinomycetota bacterium]|nr:hypothetical protein [Actinomycetota bacterium]
MRRRALPLAVAFLTLALVADVGASAGVAPGRPKHVIAHRAMFEARMAKFRQAARAAAGSPRHASVPVLNNFQLVGSHDLGLSDSNGDVWVHGNTAYVGTWAIPCNGLGVKVINVANPASPVFLGRVAGIPGTDAEDMVVRAVTTSSFTGDLLAVGIQRCDYEDPALDDDMFGVDLWNVTNPASPVHLSTLGITTGGGGVHELDLLQRGSNAYVLAATPGSEVFDPCQCGDFQLIDVTNPASPTIVGDWGAIAHGLALTPFNGRGSFPNTFAHSARASADGTKAYVSYWDQGFLTLDITNVADPTLVSQTMYPLASDGDAHSLSEYATPGGRLFLLTNDEDGDPRTPAVIKYGAGPTVGIGVDALYAPSVIDLPDGRLRAKVVRAARQGCERSDYAGLHVSDRIAVVKTYPEFGPGHRKMECSEIRQARLAEDVGAAAVVHDWVAKWIDPTWLRFKEVGLPVLFTGHDTGLGMVDAGRATLIGQEPAFGYLRVFDASTGEQVARFDDAPYVHDPAAPAGSWLIHNNEVLGDRSYASWYTNGVVALDLSPLDVTTPGDPVMVGQFVPDGAPSHVEFFPSVPLVWGVAIRPSDGLIFVSDLNGGLWIVRPTGPAAA